MNYIRDNINIYLFWLEFDKLKHYAFEIRIETTHYGQFFVYFFIIFFKES